MIISKPTLFFIALAIALNNFMWWSSVQDEERKSIESRLISQEQIKSEITNHNESASETTSVSTIAVAKATNAQPAIKNSIPEEKSPEGINTEDIDLPQDISQNFQREKNHAAESYSYSAADKKMETIQTLSAQGDDLKLIGSILNTESDSKLRVAALGRLNQAQSYAATNMLIKSLDDRDLSVSATALHIIALNGDKTLVPVLKEKVASMPNGSIRDMYEQSISTLENSGIMAMDENIASNKH